MQIVLEIKNEHDLEILLPLLERMNIPFSRIEGKRQSKAKTSSTAKIKAQKNFDVEQLENLFDELQAMNAFSTVDDPVEWQKQLRDEWN